MPLVQHSQSVDNNHCSAAVGSATGSHGVRERIPKSSNCLHGFLTIYDPYVFKFAHISQSLSLSALRGSVAVVWHDRLSVDVS